MSRAKLSLALQTDVVQDNVPCEVAPGIFIGSIHAAFNQEALLGLGVTHILNASRLPSTFPKTFTYLSIDIRDKEEANILSTIPAANIFIEAGAASGGVFVHCYGGRSRSAAFICAFLMSSHGWPYEQAHDVIQAARPLVSINAGFEAQLRAYIYAKYDVYVAQQVLLLGRVQALQRYRAIRGTSANDLEIKASQRKKFGINNVLSGGGGSRGDKGSRKKDGCSVDSSHGSHSGMKRSWRRAKDVGGDSQQLVQDEEDEEEEMDCEEQLCQAAASVMRRERSASFSKDVVLGDQPSSTAEPSTLRRHIPLLDPRSPRCRLSRPGSTSIRIIPPLRGLERVFCCSWCQFNLFNLASVIRTDIDLRPLREMLESTAEDKRGSSGGAGGGGGWGNGNRRNPFGGSSGSKDDESLAEVSQGVTDDNNSMPAPSSTMSRGRGGGGGGDSWGMGANLSLSQSVAPSKQAVPVYREPPRTMRNRDSKRFNFDDFGEVSTASPSKEEEDTKMDIDQVPSSGAKCDSHSHRSVQVPKLSIDNGHGDVAVSIPPRHNSGRGSIQVQAAGQSVGSNCISPLESPRIPLPPHQRERSSFTYPSPRDRPQSAEKTRWLARVNLLGMSSQHRQGEGEDEGDSQLSHKGERIDKMSQDDDEAIKLGFGREKYIHIEYLEWMGEDLLSGEIEEGELKCGHCQRVIGSWNWHPHVKHTLYGQLEPPLIRVHKSVVQEVDVPLDSTPSSTPREDMAGTGTVPLSPAMDDV